MPADIQSANTGVTISVFTAEEVAAHLEGLGALLHACVHAGASVNFVLPFAPADAAAFWRDNTLPKLCAGARLLLVARAGGGIVGTVQLDTDTPPNQPHRAEVSKLLVHPEMRRRGIARALMAAVERQARQMERSLITLDTRTGDTAEPLYASLGYATVGVIPGYCRAPAEDRLDSTTIMYKTL